MLEFQKIECSDRVIPEVKRFYDFFQGIPQHTLNVKFERYLNVTTLKQASEAYRSFVFKNQFFPKKNWKAKEIGLLLYLIDKICLKSRSSIFSLESYFWKRVSQLMPGRTEESCREKIYSISPSKLIQAPWTQFQEEILLEIIEKQGIKQWKTVSLKLIQKNPQKVYRSSKQCRQHYMCFLKPDLKKGFWTEEQDYQLMSLYIKYGRKWSKLSKQLEGRNQNAIKNRFSLLFQNKDNGLKLYPSEIMRKVKRRKDQLEKKFERNQQVCKQKQSNQDCVESAIDKDNEDKITSESGKQVSENIMNKQNVFENFVVEKEKYLRNEKGELVLESEYQKYFAF